jgi:hypothetical protein
MYQSITEHIKQILFRLGVCRGCAWQIRNLTGSGRHCEEVICCVAVIVAKAIVIKKIILLLVLLTCV